jgi:hypothetical protein
MPCGLLALVFRRVEAQDALRRLEKGYKSVSFFLLRPSFCAIFLITTLTFVSSAPSVLLRGHPVARLSALGIRRTGLSCMHFSN